MSSRWKWGLGVIGTLIVAIALSVWLADVPELFTGEPPARTGVPGNEWFAREERRFYAPAPVTIANHEHAIEVYTDGLVGSALRLPTLYELAAVRSYVSLAHVHRGADLLTMPELVRNAIDAQPSQLSVTPLIQALLSAP